MPAVPSGVADALHSRKEAKLKGTINLLTIAGRDFYRADFDFGQSPGHRTFLCTAAKNYLLEWSIVGLSKGDVESTISTLNGVHAASSQIAPAIPEVNTLALSSAPVRSNGQITRIRVGQGVTQGMVIKKVQPVYPQQARYAHIQGSVVMSAVISKNGDVVDLEVLDGPD